MPVRTSRSVGWRRSALRAYRVGFAPDTWDRVVNGSRRAGYTENELVAAGLATRSQRGSIFDRFRGRITFPLADERGRVLGFGARAMKPDDKPKYLNTSENDLFHKGRIVYGADLARAAAARAGRVVLVEGYTDVIALHQAGVPEVVAQMGTALTEQQVDAIARLAPKALFCQDPDRAGQESVAKGIAALRAHNKGRSTRAVEFRIVRLPAGQDPADVAQTSGGEALRGMLEKAVAIERFEVERALEQPDATTDEMLAAVAPIISTMGATILRDELVALVADRFGMTPNLVNEALRQPFTTVRRDDLRGGGQPGRGGNPPRSGWSRPPQHQQGPPQQRQAPPHQESSTQPHGGASRGRAVRHARQARRRQPGVRRLGGARPREARRRTGVRRLRGRAAPGRRAASRGIVLDPARSAAGAARPRRLAAARGGARLRASGAGRLRRAATARVGRLLGRGRGIRRRGDGGTRRISPQRAIPARRHRLRRPLSRTVRSLLSRGGDSAGVPGGSGAPGGVSAAAAAGPGLEP